MKRLACLLIVAASALLCSAAEPKGDGTVNPNEPDTRPNVMMAPKLRGPNTPPPAAPKLLDFETVCAVLFRVQIGLAKWLDEKINEPKPAGKEKK